MKIRNYLAVAAMSALLGSIGGAALRGVAIENTEKSKALRAQDAVNRIEHCKIAYLDRFIVDSQHYRKLETSERDQERFTKYLSLNMEIGSALCKDLYWNGMIFAKKKWFSLPEKTIVVPTPVVEKTPPRPIMSKEINYTPRTVYETLEQKLKAECKKETS